VGDSKQTYKGHEILVRGRTAEDAHTPTVAEAEPELYIDEVPVVTVRDSSGMYIAAGFAYAPQGSLIDLGMRIIDYREAQEGG
jgi:hypothetical protein